MNVLHPNKKTHQDDDALDESLVWWLTSLLGC